MKRREDSENINNKIKKLEGAVEDIQSKFELLNIENKELQKKITSLEGVKKNNNNKALVITSHRIRNLGTKVNNEIREKQILDFYSNKQW